MPSERHTAMLCWQLRAGLVNHQPPLALGHLEGKVRAEGGQGWALHQQLPGGGRFCCFGLRCIRQSELRARVMGVRVLNVKQHPLSSVSIPTYLGQYIQMQKVYHEVGIPK